MQWVRDMSLAELSPDAAVRLTGLIGQFNSAVRQRRALEAVIEPIVRRVLREISNEQRKSENEQRPV